MNPIIAHLSARSGRTLAITLIAVWGALALSIAAQYHLGSDFGASVAASDPPWLPSGTVIGVIWTILYGLMAVALWLVNSSNSGERRIWQSYIIMLLLACLAWPFFAFDADSRWPGIIGNLVILALSGCGVLKLWPREKIGAYCLLAVAIWSLIATISIFDSIRRYGWPLGQA